MDPQSIVLKLEEAAKVLLASPTLVTAEQRNQAERIFLEFRKFSFPYETCRFILEHSKNDYTQFQAAATIKSSIVREWAALPASDVEQLRLFLLQYVTSHLRLQAYVREEIFQTLAVIVKRGMLESDAIAKDKIFNEVSQLISTGDLSMQLIACSLLTALLNEFSSNSKSTGTGFTWEFHIRCKRHFEDNHLLHTMVFTLQVLNELVKCDTPFSRAQLPVMMRFLSIAEDILSWEFLPLRLTRRHMIPFGSLNQPALRPAISWGETICNPDLLNLFFALYCKVHDNAELSHHALQCLCQLASLNGAVFVDTDQRLAYLTKFLASFPKTIKRIELKSYDAIGISTVFENLLRWFGIELYAQISATIIDPFISLMTSLTCRYITSAKAFDGPVTEDNVYIEAVEKMLFSWTTLLMGAEDHFARGQFKKQATEIFNTYVQCHIIDPTATGVQPEADTEVYEEEDVPDKEKFSEQLTGIGILGREVTEHSLPTLARLIDQRSEKLKVYLDRHRHEVQPGVVASSQPELNSIYEDLHWLVLIATSVLTDDAQGEIALIPTQILQHSMAQANHINAQQTLNLITQPELSSSHASQTNMVDHVIRLLSAILRLFYIQSIAFQNKLGGILSPQLDSTSIYFMNRFIDGYLTPSEENYSEMSITLQTILGKDTEGSVHFINVILDKIQMNLSLWNSESQVVEETLDTLVSLVYRGFRCKRVIECQNFWTFMSSVSENAFPFNSLPATAKRQLYRTIVYCGGCMHERKEQFWEQMVRKPMEEIRALTADPAFKKRKDNSSIKESLIHGLETLIGCCQATRLGTQAALFDMVEPSLQATITILDVYHSYPQMVELCLEVFGEVVSSMICCLDSSSSERLYEQCLAAIHMYAKYNSGQRAVDAESEEDMFRDVLLIIKLLVNMMSKDLVDFGLSENGEAAVVSATEVVLFGLTVIVPIMDASLLQFPSLCSQYYKLLAFTSELRPDKVLELPANLLDLILSSIHLALTGFGIDVAKSAFEFITEISMYTVNKRTPELANKAKLHQFLQPILNLLLFEPFEVDLCDVICGCLYYLLLLYPGEYKHLEKIILDQQTGLPHHQLLTKSFNELTIPSTASRQGKVQFVDSMNKFLLDVKGFLCVL